MKTMQDFRDSLFVEDKVTAPLQNPLATLTHFSREQVNSIVAFEPWYIWTSEATK